MTHELLALNASTLHRFNDRPRRRGGLVRQQLFDGHAFGEVTRLVHVAAELDGEMIRQKL
jgi:hypothetical protein